MKHFEGGGCSLGEIHTGPCIWDTSEPVTNSVPVTNTVTNSPSDSDRVMAWRSKNKDRYNEYQREYMRRRWVRVHF